jgi:hypothetical protein
LEERFIHLFRSNHRWITIINSGIVLCPPWRNDVPLLVVVEGERLSISIAKKSCSMAETFTD